MRPARHALPHTWPDPLQRLVLRASLLSGVDASKAWHAVAPRFDPDAMPGVQRLVPLLAENLRRVGVVDAPFDAMEAIRRRSEARNDHLFAHGAQLIASLEQAGIPTVLLKGAALADSVYGGRGLRPLGDLDLLVPTTRTMAAVALAEREGWVARQPVTASVRRVKHAGHFAAADGCQLDLHWHVFEQCCGPGDDDDLWDASVPVELAGARSRVLSPSDQLLHVLVHGLTWVRTPGIRWVADATLLVRRASIDWRRLLRQARRRHFWLRTRLALRYLHSHVAVPVPTAVLGTLKTLRPCQLELLEYATLSRGPRLLGELPAYWCRYVREVDERGPGTAIGFVGYLQQAWDLASVTDIPRAVVRRAHGRLAGAGRAA